MTLLNSPVVYNLYQIYTFYVILFLSYNFWWHMQIDNNNLSLCSLPLTFYCIYVIASEFENGMVSSRLDD